VTGEPTGPAASGDFRGTHTRIVAVGALQESFKPTGHGDPFAIEDILSTLLLAVMATNISSYGTNAVHPETVENTLTIYVPSPESGQ